MYTWCSFLMPMYWWFAGIARHWNAQSEVESKIKHSFLLHHLRGFPASIWVSTDYWVSEFVTSVNIQILIFIILELLPTFLLLPWLLCTWSGQRQTVWFSEAPSCILLPLNHPSSCYMSVPQDSLERQIPQPIPRHLSFYMESCHTPKEQEGGTNNKSQICRNKNKENPVLGEEGGNVPASKLIVIFHNKYLAIICKVGGG